MLKHRVISSTLLILLLLAVALLMKPSGLTIVVALVGGLAAWEFSSLLTAAGIRHERTVGVLGGVAWLVTVGLTGGTAMEGEILLLLALVVVTALTVMARHDAQPLTAVPGTLLIAL